MDSKNKSKKLESLIKNIVKEEIEKDYSKIPYVSADTIKNILASGKRVMLSKGEGTSVKISNTDDLEYFLYNDLTFKQTRPGEYTIYQTKNHTDYDNITD